MRNRAGEVSAAGRVGYDMMDELVVRGQFHARDKGRCVIGAGGDTSLGWGVQ